MKKLSLIKGLSYSLRGFSCVKGKPFEVEDELAEQLIGTGRFEEMAMEMSEEDVTPPADLDPAIPPTTPPADLDPAIPPTTPPADLDPDGKQKRDDELTASKVAKLRNEELFALAEEENISLDGCTKHDEYVKRINEALNLVDFASLGLE